MPQPFDSELGAFVDEICADLCRVECAATAGCAPGRVEVGREVGLGNDVSADIRGEAPAAPPSVVETKLATAPADLVARLRRKYGQPSPAWHGAQRLAVLLDRAAIPQWAEFERELRAAVAPGLTVEVWDVAQLLARIRATFQHEITDISRTSLLDARTAIERAQWRIAFDGKFPDDPRAATLLWHLSPWELGRLYRDERLGPAEILEPRTYHEVVVVMADLCAYTSFVRDTRDPGLIRRRLTEYYSLARHAVLNAGGMLYQFVGDEVVAVFGLHRSPAPAVVQALTCVRSLFAAGDPASLARQRVLDPAQPPKGGPIGIPPGGLGLMTFRPFSQTRSRLLGQPLHPGNR